MGRTLSGHRPRFRIDRGSRLRESLAVGRIDVALLLGPDDEATAAVTVGELELTWYSAPGWTLPPADQAVPVVAFDEPCVLRTRALDTLARHGLPAVVASEAIQLAGVQAAVRAGIGVALMATIGQSPEGLIARDDLPRPAPLPLPVRPRQGLSAGVTARTVEALRPLLATPAVR